MQALGIPFSALVSVIFGLMILSFPLGAYVVFNSNVGEVLRYDVPISDLELFPVGLVPFELELGDVFIVLWSIFLILFTIAMLGPKKNFLKALSPFMSSGAYESKTNYLVSIIKWFAVLVVVSVIIDGVQQSIGITTEPPQQPDVFSQFFYVTAAPIFEEIGFRVILIGIPIFLIYSHRASVALFFKSLWNPSQTLNIYETKKALILIVGVGVFFGIAHVISEDAWSVGKISQATASGIIIGWVYFKHGFPSAVLVHWAANYFVFSYVYLLADINEISIKNAFSHSLTNSLEILLIITGVLSAAILILNYINLKKEKKLEI